MSHVEPALVLAELARQASADVSAHVNGKGSGTADNGSAMLKSAEVPQVRNDLVS